MKKSIIVSITLLLSAVAFAQDSAKPAPATEADKDQLIKEYQQQVSDLQALVRQYKAKSESLEKQAGKSKHNKTSEKPAPIKMAGEPASPDKLPPASEKLAKKLVMELSPEEKEKLKNNPDLVKEGREKLKNNPDLAQQVLDDPELMQYWTDGLKDIIAGGTKPLKPMQGSGNQPPNKTTLTGGGTMQVKNRTVTVKSDMSRTCSLNCPLKMSGNYDIELLFTRQLGNTQINFVLPVGQTAVKLVLDKYQGTTYDLDYRKYVAGLEYINGLGVLNNDTRIENFNMNNGRSHSLDIKVRTEGDQAIVVVFLDRQQLANWRGPVSALSAYPAQASNQPRGFSIEFAPNQTVKLSNMRVKNFKNKAAR